jgi:putative transposase
MARKRKYLQEPNMVVHAFNRGVGRGEIFHNRRDYERFLEMLAEALKEIAVSLVVYTLMPNHFHLILLQHEPYAVSCILRKVCQPYSRWLNARSGRRGTNFEGRYGGVPVFDPAGLLRLSYYIQMNPVAAGLVPSPDLWPYSSYKGCLDTAGGHLNGYALLHALVGGPGAYERFMKQFDSADPESVKEFLCLEYATVWAERGAEWFR